MSIIEEAVRKTAERYQRPAPPEQPAGRAPAATRAASAADTANVRRFQPVTLDRAVLDDNNILPQITDPGALRGLQDPAHSRAAPAGSQSVAFVRGHGRDARAKARRSLPSTWRWRSRRTPTPGCFWSIWICSGRKWPAICGLNNSLGERGLTDYLLGDATFEQITYSPTGMDRLAVIPNFQTVANASDLLTSPRMDELVQSLEAEMPRRIVIFDMPPVLASDDVLAFSPQVDGMLLVVAEGLTSRDALKSAKSLLQEMNLLGVVLNRSEAQDEGAYYSYAR